ncbi:MAG TPA: serine/threonine-protein kinase [Vicinamibacterales bacterium]|nr:serine/threonine-protein kinase [Vicinamibacterales bacterium]
MTASVAHFNILERLGGGALGEVYRARDTKVGRTVALMMAPPELVADPSLRARFLDDARIAAGLNHPNIATLFDVVEQDDRCYLAYEFAAGPSLRQEMGGMPVNPRRALDLAAHIADGLSEGHAHGLVHGDVRPETIVVTPKGSAKILNFGMARWTAGGAARARAAGSSEVLAGDDAHIAGYLSPEQALGAAADSRTDIFSFGAVLYEMFTGRQPFAAPTTAATVMNVVRHTPARPSTVNPSLPVEIDAILSKSLAKDLEGRYQTAALLAADLRRVATALDVSAGDAARTELIPIEEERTNSIVWIAVVGGLLAIALVWWYLQRG